MSDDEIRRSYASVAEVAALKREVERLRGALEEIKRSHVPSQPATAAGSDFEWAMMHVGNLRRIARAALAQKEPGDEG
jgi:hypothetical protein